VGHQPQPFSLVLAQASKLWSDAPVIKGLLALIAVVVTYLLPTQVLQEMAIATIVLIGLDTVTGFAASISAGRAITSARFSRALVKILAYFSVVVVVAIAQRHIPGAASLEGATMVGVMTLIIVTESISVLENVRTMGFALPLGLEKWLEDRIQKP
jgi:phage-related holin